MSQGKNSKVKLVVVTVVVLAIAAAIGFGAYKGRTKESAPSELAFSAGDSKASGGNNAGKTKKDVLRTWTRKDCSLAPWLVTDKLGYFEEEGIELKFTGELQTNQQIPSIISGDNDVSSVHPNSLAVAVNGGAKLKGVSRGILEPDESVDPKFRHMWYFVNPSKHPDIKSFEDLKKLPGEIKVTTAAINQCTDFITNVLAKKYGIPKDKFKWVTMQDLQATQALKQGLVDLAPVHPPFYKGMEDAGELKIADSFESDLGPAAGLTIYYFREEFIEKNPDLVKRFVRAISKGQRYANEHPEEVAKWVEEAIGVPVTGNHYYCTDTTIDESQLIPWLKQLEENKVIPKGKLKPSDLVTHVFEKYGNEG